VSPPLRLGVALAAGTDPGAWQGVLRAAELADSLGFHSVWVPEGHFRRGATPSPLVTLAAFAARTRRLRLGTTSLLLPIHPAARLASEVAALDALSGGRVILGLGRGFQEPVFRGFGVRAAEKRDRFDESLDAILGIWRAGGAAIRPLQRPHPPLVVAAFGRKGLLQAARRGLPYLASPLESLAVLEENHRFHREHLAAELAGEIRVPVMRTLHVAADDAEARAVRGALAAEALRLSASGATLARAAAGPLEDRVLVGTRSEVIDGLALYRERLGMDLVVVRPAIGAAPAGAFEDSLARLAAEVAPALAV
jgi:alkanesulfonate monooxygenase SsuD/methylene tetrahydromethanopterin reductase-like flavin-dependent oxidoreductase (luciferase family)